MAYSLSSQVERRSTTRHIARTLVRVKTRAVKTRAGKNKLCRVINLSQTGVGIKTDDMSLRVGETVDLIFIINLGTVQKLHYRTARVVRVKDGITGIVMRPFGDKKSTFQRYLNYDT